MCNNVCGRRIELWDELGQVDIYMTLLARPRPSPPSAIRTSPSWNSTLKLVVFLWRRGIAIAQWSIWSILRSIRTIPRTVSVTFVRGYSVPSCNDIHLAFGFCYCRKAAEASNSCSMKSFTKPSSIILWIGQESRTTWWLFVYGPGILAVAQNAAFLGMEKFAPRAHV